MTTVAYRNGVLAVDRQMTHGQFSRPTDCKLQIVHTSFSRSLAIAFTGSYAMGLAFCKWMEAGSVQGEFPMLIDRKAGFHALVVPKTIGIAGPDECQYYSSDLIAISEAEAPYVAQGAGDEFALGAMWQGATAVQAIQAANAHCLFSNYGVLYVDVTGDFLIHRLEENGGLEG